MAYPTNPIYKLQKNPITEIVDSVNKRIEGGTVFVPFNKENTDYQEYLEWVAEGNTAEASD